MSRGVYRGVHSSLFDDPDYQRLSSDARLVLVSARQCKEAGPAVIFRYYPEVLCRQTGLSRRRLERALDDLEVGNWAYHDDHVLWVRNGLRHDPNIRLNDRKHLASVVRQLEGLPSSPLIARFRDYYKIARPFVDLAHESASAPPSTSTNTENENEVNLLSGKPDAASLGNGNCHRTEARTLLAFLNLKTGRTYRPTEGNLRLIEARLKAGASVEDCRGVIARKVRAWASDPKMAPYLRPATLFNQTKFDQYVGEQGT